MDAWVEKRMWANLFKGVACLMAGALAIVAIEHAWHGGVFDAEPGKQAQSSAESDATIESGQNAERGSADEPLEVDLASFVFDGEDAAIGFDGVSRRFAEECFDPQDMGEVRSSFDGGVVGIVSDLEASELFDACVRRFINRGWYRISDAQPLRCSFAKGNGAIRWVFLDVTKVSNSSVAVIVVEEMRDDDQAA